MASTSEKYIPETPAELTPDWLTRALTANGVLNGQRVVEATSQVLGEGEGFLGDILRLRLRYDEPVEGAPASVIAKLPKLANRGMGELLGAYERENCFYMEFGQRLPVRTPRMYYGDFDRDPASEKQEEIMQVADQLPKFLINPMTALARWIAGRKKRRYILLLEDITDAASGDQVAGADISRCIETLNTIARAHAAFWAEPELSNQFWLLPLNIDTRMRHSMFRKSTPAFTRMFQTEMDQGLATYMQTVEEQGVEMMRTLCEAPTTLLHCDLRLDNLFFDEDGVIVFDWQLVRRGPAAYDVAYFLSGALDEHAGAGDIDLLLAAYHEALSASGVTDYALADLQRDYRLALHNVLQSLATIDQVDLGDGRGIPLMRSWIRRLHARLRAADAQ